MVKASKLTVFSAHPHNLLQYKFVTIGFSSRRSARKDNVVMAMDSRLGKHCRQPLLTQCKTRGGVS